MKKYLKDETKIQMFEFLKKIDVKDRPCHAA